MVFFLAQLQINMLLTRKSTFDTNDVRLCSTDTNTEGDMNMDTGHDNSQKLGHGRGHDKFLLITFLV